MPAHSKIVDEDEARRWYDSGVPYRVFVERYREMYGVETTEAMWSQWRYRKKLPRRAIHDPDLVPWTVAPQHRYESPLNMLRLEGQRRAGRRLSAIDQSRLEGWKERVREANAVVYYDPDTDVGFFYVPREEGDDEFIRPPVKVS